MLCGDLKDDFLISISFERCPAIPTMIKNCILYQQIHVSKYVPVVGTVYLTYEGQ